MVRARHRTRKSAESPGERKKLRESDFWVPSGGRTPGSHDIKCTKKKCTQKDVRQIWKILVPVGKMPLVVAEQFSNTGYNLHL